MRFPAWAVLSVCLLSVVPLTGGCSSPTTPTPPPPVPDPPKVSCPAPVTQVSPRAEAMPVVFGMPTTTAGAAPVTTVCTPASGSVFPLGTTAVTCTATDARQRTDACTFSVVVQSPARIGATTFLAFGDSITSGEDGNNPTLRSQPGGWEAFTYPTVLLVGKEYPTVLRQLLAARYTLQSIVVANAGRGGEAAGTSSAVARFTDLVATRQFEVALVMEGTNDISDGTTSRVGPAISGLRSMILAAKFRGVRPYLATVPPMNPEGPRGRRGYATVPLLNREIRALATQEGVPLVDVEQAFGRNMALLAEDGLHPNADGLAVVGKAFYDVIVATLEAAAPSSQSLVPGHHVLPAPWPWR